MPPRLGVDDGGRVARRDPTRRGRAPVELTDTMQPGHVSLPNGLGPRPIPTRTARRSSRRRAERADLSRRPRLARRHAWHKHVRARLEAVAGRLSAPHSLRRLAVPDRTDHRPHRRLVDAARAARRVRRRAPLRRLPARPSASRARCWPQRLDRLVDEGLLPRCAYEERPPRVRVPAHRQGPRVLGRARRDVALGRGLAVARRRAPPVVLVDRETGEEIRPVVVDEHTGTRLDVRRTKIRRR